MLINRICPKCGKWKYEIFVPSSKSIDGEKGNLLIKCMKCDWNGIHKDLLTKEEYKNKNRAQLIERMLEI